jgi:hypothetical protein
MIFLIFGCSKEQKRLCRISQEGRWEKAQKEQALMIK